MLYSVRGKFADKHTFSVNPVDGATPHEALASVVNSEEIKSYGHPVTQITVIQLAGKKRVRISQEPAKDRVKGAKKATAPAAPSAASKQATNRR